MKKFEFHMVYKLNASKGIKIINHKQVNASSVILDAVQKFRYEQNLTKMS